jgi:hypothetical protein
MRSPQSRKVRAFPVHHGTTGFYRYLSHRLHCPESRRFVIPLWCYFSVMADHGHSPVVVLYGISRSCSDSLNSATSPQMHPFVQA